MSALPSARPGLFRGGVPGAPARLIGRRCRACGRAHFPPQDYGCEDCGAHCDDFPEVELAGTGRIKGLAALHRHALAGAPSPAWLAEIVLDEGPALEALLEPAEAQRLAAGARVGAVLVETEDGRVELRFRAA